MEIEEISFEITALLGKSTLSWGGYLSLQVGDVLVLDQPIEKGLTARIGSEERFLATAGLFETHKAIVIDERLHPR